MQQNAPAHADASDAADDGFISKLLKVSGK